MKTACLKPIPEIKYVSVTRMVVVCCWGRGRGAFTLRNRGLPYMVLKLVVLFCFVLFLFLSFVVVCVCVCVCACMCLFRMAFHWEVLSTHCYGCVHFIVIVLLLLGKHFQ